MLKISIIIFLIIGLNCLGEKKTEKDVKIEEIVYDVPPSECVIKKGLPFKNSCPENGKCAEGKECVSGLCAVPPKEETSITDFKNEKPTSEKPKLDCIENPFPNPDGPKKVRLYGIVDRFGGGGITIGMKVSVFLFDEWHPEVCECEKDKNKRLECFINYGSAIGEGVSFDSNSDKPEKISSLCEKHLECPMGYMCDTKHNECLKQYGYYQIDNIPTNTPIVIRVRATIFSEKWHDAYIYFAYLYASSAEKCGEKEGCDYKYRYNPTSVSDDQWILVPNTMGVGEIKEGNSAIGGRIQDCGDKDRPSWPISHAIVQVGNPGSVISYFNDIEDDALPLKKKTSTDIFGRFAALDIEPGWNRVTAGVLLNGKITSLGNVDLYILPNSLFLVTFPGRRSYIRK